MLYNRASIFPISGVYAICSFGMCMIYFITFSEIVKSFFQDALGVTDDDDVTGFKGLLVNKGTWVVLLAVGMLPIIIKKELQELHIVSTLLFIATMVFILIVFIQLCVFGTHKFSGNTPYDYNDVALPYKGGTFYTWMKTLSIFLVAFSFTINLFPIYSGLKVKTN